VAGKLYYLPIVMAAAWFGGRATAAVTAAVSALSLAHIARNWAGLPMVQAEQLAEITTFWLVGMVSAWLFHRERAAREATRVAHEETLGALASSLELRERYTGGHSRRVRDYSLLLADEMGIRDPSFRASLAQGALLHDVGKIGIPDRILLKPSPLEPSEQDLMRRHPEMGAALVGEIAWLRGPGDLIRAHHERYDGSGYPRGLAGAAIPLAARIFAVGDAFDALTTDRPYHAARSWQEAASTIAGGRASQFDPDVADAFSRIPFESWASVAAATGVRLRRDAASAGLRLSRELSKDPASAVAPRVNEERL
jgi:HD-GYP domain-containing protein (c-di-GMP phosphodiesterase class II)